MGSGRDQGWVADGRVVRVVRHDPAQPVDTMKWPATVPAVEHLLCEGLEFPAGLTVLVGENGSGKSTIVEMLARAYGLNPAGGSAQAGLFQARDTQPPGAGPALIVERGPGRPAGPTSCAPTPRIACTPTWKTTRAPSARSDSIS